MSGPTLSELLDSFEASATELWIPRITKLGFTEVQWQRHRIERQVGARHGLIALSLVAMPYDSMVWATFTRGEPLPPRTYPENISVVSLCLLESPTFGFNVNPVDSSGREFSSVRASAIIARYADLLDRHWGTWSILLQDWEQAGSAALAALRRAGDDWWRADRD